MLLYVGLSVVSITINLCAQSLLTQLRKTGLHLKIIQLFSSHEDWMDKTTTRAQGRGRADANDCRLGLGESIAMSDLEKRQNDGIEDDKQTSRLKIVHDVERKRYGTLQAE